MGNSMPPPPIRAQPPARGSKYRSIDLSNAGKAVETVRASIPYLTPAVMVRVGPAGDLCVEAALLYGGLALDKVHYDIILDSPSPKGRPACVFEQVKPDINHIKEVMEGVLRGAQAVEAAEFREPESCWAVPIAWKNLIIAYVKVSEDGSELVYDLGITDEVRRYFQ